MAEFSTDIHPQFSGVPNTQFAQAASELFFRLGDFTVAGKGSASEFPPEPSTLAAMQLAYIEDEGDDWRVRRQFLTLGDNKKTASEFSHAYARDMKIVERAIPTIGEETTPADAEFLAIAPNISRRAGLRTVASFALFRSVRNPNRTYGGLIIPKAIREQGPLEFRHIFVSVMDQVGGKQELKDLYKEMDESEGKMLDDILRVQDAALSAGAILAVAHLPSIEVVREMIGRSMKPTPHQGLNRVQRRAQRKR